MKRPREPNRSGPTADLDALIAEITVDADGEGEQLSAFQQAFEEDLPLPADARVIGVPVSVLGFDFDGNERVGLRARCGRRDGTEHMVSAAEVLFPEGSSAARLIAAYRRWLGLPPWSPGDRPAE